MAELMERTDVCPLVESVEQRDGWMPEQVTSDRSTYGDGRFIVWYASLEVAAQVRALHSHLPGKRYPLIPISLTDALREAKERGFAALRCYRDAESWEEITVPQEPA